MPLKFSIAVFAIACLMAMAVMGAGPPAKTTAAVDRSSAKTAIPTAVTPACDERVVTTQSIKEKTTGTKMQLEELSRFDFKIDETVKPLDGYIAPVEHVPITRDIRTSRLMPRRSFADLR